MNMRNVFFKVTLLLSLLVGASTFIFYGYFFDHSDVDVTLPERWQRMSVQEKLDSLGGLLSKGALFSPLSGIKQFKIRRQLREMIVRKEDEVLGDVMTYRFGFRYYLGWEELGLLGLAGFASVWVLYVAARIIVLLIPPPRMEPLPSLPSGGRIRYARRPAKPRAVWID